MTRTTKRMTAAAREVQRPVSSSSARARRRRSEVSTPRGEVSSSLKSSPHAVARCCRSGAGMLWGTRSARSPVGCHSDGSKSTESSTRCRSGCASAPTCRAPLVGPPRAGAGAAEGREAGAGAGADVLGGGEEVDDERDADIGDGEVRKQQLRRRLRARTVREAREVRSTRAWAGRDGAGRSRDLGEAAVERRELLDV
jgi:hypothetical protein